MPPADDHRREGDGQQPELHAEPGDLEEVADREKVRRNDGEQRDLGEEGKGQPPFAIRKPAAAPAMVVRRGLPREPARVWSRPIPPCVDPTLQG